MLGVSSFKSFYGILYWTLELFRQCGIYCITLLLSITLIGLSSYFQSSCRAHNARLAEPKDQNETDYLISIASRFGGSMLI